LRRPTAAISAISFKHFQLTIVLRAKTELKSIHVAGVFAMQTRVRVALSGIIVLQDHFFRVLKREKSALIFSYLFDENAASNLPW
jgi:hypothetical protein